MYTGLLHTHRLVVILFLCIYLIKLTLLLLNQKERLAFFTKKVKVPEMVISSLFLLTGILMLVNMSSSLIDQWLLIKIGLVLVSIPIAVMGFRRENKLLGILAVFLIVCVYGLAEMRKAKVIKNEPASSVITDASNASYDAIAHGKALFEANCIACHGVNGKLMLSGAKDLSLSQKSEAELKNVIRKGKNAMQAYEKVFTDQEIEALGAYVMSLRP